MMADLMASRTRSSRLPVDKDLYELPPEEAANIPQTPVQLSAVIDRLEEDHEYLTEGGVFTPDLIETWISFKRENEILPVQISGRIRTSSRSTTTYKSANALTCADSARVRVPPAERPQDLGETTPPAQR